MCEREEGSLEGHLEQLNIPWYIRGMMSPKVEKSPLMQWKLGEDGQLSRVFFIPVAPPLQSFEPVGALPYMLALRDRHRAACYAELRGDTSS